MGFYHCAHCGNIIIYAKNNGVPVVCCGDKMRKLQPKNPLSEDFGEYDIQISRHDKLAIVAVGSSKPHPMTPAHYIEWITLETKEGYQRKELKPLTESIVKFSLCKTDEIVAAYVYCNVHGLAKND